MFNDKLITALKQDVFDFDDEEDLKDHINDYHNIVIPFKMQILAQLYTTKTYEEVDLEQKCYNLKDTWSAKKSLEKIKRELFSKYSSETKTKLDAGIGDFFKNLRNMIQNSDDEEGSDAEKESR